MVAAATDIADNAHRALAVPDRALGWQDRGMDLRLDHLRRERTGLAEAVYAPGKSPAQCAEAVAGLLAGPGSGPVLLTRATADQAAAASAQSPGAVTARGGYRRVAACR